MQSILPKYLYGILGNPLGHSMSPALHNQAFTWLGYPAAYFSWEKSGEELENFFRAVRSLPVSGLSVTIPHKESVIPFLDVLCPRAERAGAVNTVFWRDGRLMGDNSDVAGFLAPLRKYPRLPGSAIILGAGGVCRAALAGLRELGIGDITVAARNPGKTNALAKDFDCTVIPWDLREREAAEMGSALIINATPLGMRGSGQSQSPVSEAFWRKIAESGRDNLAYDLVYSPVSTVFLKQATAAGVKGITGLDFFVAQAIEQLRLWTEKPLPDDMASECRVLVVKLLGEQQGFV